MKNIVLTLLILLSFNDIDAKNVNDKEAAFYINKMPNKVIVLDDLSGNEDSGDSQLLNQAIAKLSKAGGGVLLIKKPKQSKYIYVREVNLQSNVHIKVEPDVIFRLWNGGDKVPRNKIMFSLGGKMNISNVAITNLEEDSNDPETFFKVELTGGKSNRVKFIDIVSAYNFKVSGMEFFDSNTVYSNVECNLRRDQSLKEGDLPTQGIIKNILSHNNHVGYGIVQIRAGKRILFKNLDGEGGITLRMESGFARKVLSADASIDACVGRNITIRNGKSALSMSPHRIKQGWVDIRGISAYNSMAAVEIGNGFYDNKGGVDNLGTFSSDSYVGDFKKVEGGKTAQVKSKYFTQFECEQQTELKDNFPTAPDGESSYATSLAVVEYSSHPDYGCSSEGKRPMGCYTIQLDLPKDEVISGTFLHSDPISYSNVQKYTCETSAADKAKKEKQPKIIVNAEENMLKIKLNGLKNVEILRIYSLSGSFETKHKLKENEQEVRISTVSWEKGNYIIAFTKEKKMKFSLK
ncbi:hypothetical protein [Saccharicrinis aurantiacus]|uniref:hypothetical protein n=1 Tax=Saccharicrinis aurantiacus TaxID=1849719 RepID=UPI0008398B9E|nr:hypothetical protein [Saccharicrinis aurantiacus]